MPFCGNAEVVESKHWKRDDGRTASIYGSAPWASEAERGRWQMVSRGWDIRWTGDGSIGRCKPPFETKEEAETFADEWNAKRAAAYAAAGKEAPAC